MTTNVDADQAPVRDTLNNTSADTLNIASTVASTLASVVLAPPEVTAGAPPAPIGAVTLDRPAPAGGLTVELGSDHPEVAQVPASVELAEGMTAYFFDVAVHPVEQPETVVIRAGHDTATQSASLVVRPSTPHPSQPQESIVFEAAAGSPAPTPQVPSANGIPDLSAKTSVAPPTGLTEASVSASAPTPAAPIDSTAPPAPAVPAASVAGRAAGGQSIAGALLVVTPSVPMLATIAAILIYASPESPRLVSLLPFVKQNPVLVGFGIALLVGLVAAVLVQRVTGNTSAEQANAAEYSQLLRRIGALDARLTVLHSITQLSDSQRIALRQAETYRQQLDDRLGTAGIDWVVATGYVSLWNLVHAAEEVLLLVDPVEDVVRAALYDDLRIQGSALGNAADLQAKLRLAVVRLQPDAAAYFSQPPGAPPTAAQAPVAADARAVVADVRQNINEFRDDNRDAMVRSRGHLQATVTVTGVATFIALGLALNGRTADAPVDPLTDSVLAAATFFIVGAMIGLFNRLANEASNDSSIEDYGLSTERMRLTPVLSGLAALAGVVVVAMVPAVLNNSVFALVSTTNTSSTIPMLYQVYSLSGNPVGVIFAAIFGLTPTLALGALQAAGEKYRANLKSTTAAPTP